MILLAEASLKWWNGNYPGERAMPKITLEVSE